MTFTLPWRLALLLPLTLLVGAPALADNPDPSEDRFFIAILSEDDSTEYSATPSSLREDWRRRYWAAHDPTPTTDENQAEVEHMTRIKEAIRRFRNAAGEFSWDERARAFIRFGKPDRIEKLPGEVQLHEGLVGPRELWVYEDMIIWFMDRRLNGHYEIARDPMRRISQIGLKDGGLREDSGRLDDHDLDFEESFDQWLVINDFELAPDRAHKLALNGLDRWEHTPEINGYDYQGGEEFPFVFDVSHLAGANGATDLLIGFLVPLDQVEFATDLGKETAALQRRIALRDSEANTVARKVENIEHERDPTEGDNGWMLTSDSVAVEPGEYELALRVIDLRSGNHGLLRSGLSVRDYDTDLLQVSDLVFATSITRDDRSGGAFNRGPFRIVPRPVRIFAPGEDLNLYFEIYHLRTSSTGKGLYELRYTLYGARQTRFSSWFGGSHEGTLEPGTTQTFRSESNGETGRRHIVLDTSALPEDRYTIIVEATDLATKATDSVRAQFVVKR